MNSLDCAMPELSSDILSWSKISKGAAFIRGISADTS
jgi:hypothetical protein